MLKKLDAAFEEDDEEEEQTSESQVANKLSDKIYQIISTVSNYSCASEIKNDCISMREAVSAADQQRYQRAVEESKRKNQKRRVKVYDPFTYKKQLCAMYNHNQLCKFSDTCEFAHGLDELRK